MWLFTVYGFFSATVSREDSTKIQIRARSAADLRDLMERFEITATIISTPESDYHWRIIVTPEQWRDIAAWLAEDVDYSNFKDAAHATQHDKPLMAVWSLMHRYQETIVSGLKMMKLKRAAKRTSETRQKNLGLRYER